MKWLKLALSVVIVAASLEAIRYVSYMQVRCNDVAMTVGNDMTKMATWSDLSLITVATRENLARIEPCRQRLPWNIDLQMLAAANYAARDQHDDAIRVFEEALRYDHRPELYFGLGQELLKAGRVDEAIRPLAIAYSIKTNYIMDIDNIDVRARVMAAVDPRGILRPRPNASR